MFKETRALLEKLDHFPSKKLGQNFLIDANIVRKSIEMAEIQADDDIVEIGPGLGTLTQALLETDAYIWAVERDHTLAGHLQENLRPNYPRLHLIEGDCLKYPRANLPQERATSGFKVVANLPYAISTPWMDAILSGPLPQRMVLMLQKEAADRYCANHCSKAFGAISIFLQSAYVVHSRHLVSANCFYPKPKIESVLLRLELRENPVCFSTQAYNSVRRIFTQRRKQLGSLCKGDPSPQIYQWFEQLVASGIKTTVRPEELPIECWQDLARIIL
ncbi:MAG: 16S rRNA (adenine1518-N6/adenine1519-N6)-dimethyltransferase [Lentimonas sp.]|jgi:16S rRNA (adenine1518-N6/adenine1519-N6)-dimethyltransferase